MLKMNAFLLSILITLSREICVYVYRRYLSFEYLVNVPFFGLSRHASQTVWNFSIYSIFLIVFAFMVKKLLCAGQQDNYAGEEPNILENLPDDLVIPGPHGDISDNSSSSSDEF